MALCLFGPTGSGKTKWKNLFVSEGINNLKSYTTRVPRNSEDKEYNFVSKEQFLEMHNKGELLNVNLDYQGEMYGIRTCAFKTRNVLITDIYSIRKLKSELWWKKCKQFLVYCVPLKNFQEELILRETPERIKIAEEEIEYFKKAILGFQLYGTIRNEKDANLLLARFKEQDF